MIPAALERRPGVRAELRGVGKRFDGVQALAQVDLTIEPGLIHALVGENGAGKSTLAKILAGMHRPDEGEVWVDGRRVRYRSPREALADGVTMIAQEPTLVPYRSVMENVLLGIEPTRRGLLTGRAARRRFGELAAAAGFSLAADARVGALRVADQQKVEVLRAVARRARLIVMDEPTAPLTPNEASVLFEIARALRAAGTTLVYVTHFLREVLELADTVTVLRDGRLVRSGPAAAETPRSLVTAMLGRSQELAFPERRPLPVGAPVALSVRGLSRPPAIYDVSLDVRAGEIVALAGLVGSGRTEVARAIFGADRASAGRIAVDGRALHVRRPRDAVRAGMAFIPESRKDQGLVLLRSIADNVMLPHLAEVSRSGVLRERGMRETATDLMRRVGVRATGPDARTSSLSGGNQQKVLFARWLYRRPRVLIADEPTRGVDVGAKRAIYDIVADLAVQGLAVLLISSEHEEVLGLAHRVLVMRGGAVVAELEGDEMRIETLMDAAFGLNAPPGGRAA